ncbi:MAG: acyltransferase, partial [Thermodesulfobacteriota bacterium]
MIDASLGASRLEDEPARGLDPAPAHVAVVDGLRGAAALLVLLYHCWVFTDPPLDGGPLRALAACGALGVDFFFVISGFVLFLPVARRGGAFGSVRGYLLRRVARIVPAYYASLLLQALAVPLLTPFATPFASAGGWLVLAAHLLFVQHELPASLAHAAGFRGDVLGFGVNGVLWSLSIEALFYVTLPLVAGAFFRRPLSGLLGALLATLCWRAAVPALGPGASAALIDQYPAFLLHFAFGMCGALLYVRLWPERGSRAAAIVVVQLASLVALLLAMTSYGRVVAATPPGAAVELLPGLLP